MYRGNQQVHVGPWLPRFLVLCQCVCVPASVHQPASVFIFLCIHMCTGHGWLCTCLFAIVHSLLAPSFPVHECVPLGFQPKPLWPCAFSSDSVSGGMAVGWASTTGTPRPIGDNYRFLIAARGKNKKEREGVALKSTNFICALLTTIFTGYHLSE